MAEEQSGSREEAAPTLPVTPRPISPELDDGSGTANNQNVASPAKAGNEYPKPHPRQSTARTVFHQRRGDDDTL